MRPSRNKYKEKSERTYFSVRSDYADKMKKVKENYPIDNTCDNRDCFYGLFGATINAFGSMPSILQIVPAGVVHISHIVSEIFCFRGELLLWIDD